MPCSLLDLADDLLARGGAAIRIDGRSVPLRHAGPDPMGLLGVRFGPNVDAVAFHLGVDPGPVLAVDRSGEAMIVDERGAGRPPDPARGSLVLDLARRSLGLPTAPPDRRVADLVDAVWIDRILHATLDAPLGEPPGWIALGRLHPGARGPAPSPELLRHRANDTPGWHELREHTAEGGVWWTPVSATLARWFDIGSMARHAFAALPEIDAVRADLADLLPTHDLVRIDATLTR